MKKEIKKPINPVGIKTTSGYGKKPAPKVGGLAKGAKFGGGMPAITPGMIDKAKGVLRKMDKPSAPIKKAASVAQKMGKKK